MHMALTFMVGLTTFAVCLLTFLVWDLYVAGR